MIDLVLLVFCIGVFYAGFWCGRRYTSLGAMFSAFGKWVKGLLS